MHITPHNCPGPALITKLIWWLMVLTGGMQENQQLRSQLDSCPVTAAPVAPDPQASVVLEQYEEDIRHLSDRVAQQERQLGSQQQQIAQLQAQLECAREEAAACREEAVSAHGAAAAAANAAAVARQPAVASPVESSRHTEELSELRGKLSVLQQQLSAKEHANVQLQAQLRGASGLSSTKTLGAGASAAEKAAQVEALQAVLEVKEQQLAEALAQVKDLRATGAKSSDERAAEADAALADAQRARDSALQQVAVLERRVAAVQAEANKQVRVCWLASVCCSHMAAFMLITGN